MADWNGQVDIAGWFNKMLRRVVGSWISLLVAFKEIRQLRKNLSVISQHADVFQSWKEDEFSRFKSRSNTFWIKLDSLVFKVEDDKSKLRKLLLGGVKTVPCLYVVSPSDAEVVLQQKPPFDGEYAFAVKDEDGKMTKVDPTSDNTWWQRLSDETTKAVERVHEAELERETEKTAPLEEARKLMNFDSDERRSLLRKWGNTILKG